MVTTATYPVAPTVTPIKGTLLDAARVTDGIAWLEGDGLFESYNCMRFEQSADFCAPNAKTFDQGSVWQDGFRFAAYGGVVCKAIGLDQANMQSEVERVFNSGESFAVERALVETRLRADTETEPRWGAPIDLTPAGGAVAPEVGVGILEGYTPSVYAGAPTLHVPRSIASIVALKGGLVEDGQVIRTKLGSKVAAGAGYDYPNTGPTGVEAAAGEKWLYATGEVVVLRGPAIVRQVMAHDTNDVFVLAERGYIAAVDCFTAAVRVTVTA